MNLLKKFICYFFIPISLNLVLALNIMAANDNEDIFYASKTGNTVLIENILSQKGQKEDVNQQDYLGNTPLIYSCSIGKEDAVKLLLKKKASPNIVNNDGISPLIAACTTNNFDKKGKWA